MNFVLKQWFIGFWAMSKWTHLVCKKQQQFKKKKCRFCHKSGESAAAWLLASLERLGLFVSLASCYDKSHNNRLILMRLFPFRTNNEKWQHTFFSFTAPPHLTNVLSLSLFMLKKKKDEEFMTATIKELHFVWGDTSISLSLCCLFYFLFSSLFLLYSLSLHSPSVVSLSVSVLLLCSLIFLNSIRRFHFFMIIHWHHWTAKSALSLSLSLSWFISFPLGCICFS